MSKRGQNEGSIYKRKDGRWAGAVSLGYVGGKLKRKAVYGGTRREVQDRMTVILRDQLRGIPAIGERQTLADFLERWLSDVVRPSVRPRTHTSYEQLVRLHLKPALGRLPLVKLTPEHVQQFMNDKLGAGLSARTVQYLRAVLRRALSQALRWNLVARNVATLVDPPKAKRKAVRVMSPDEVSLFLDAAKGQRFEPLLIVAISTGLRQGELLGLRWEDVDLPASVIHVRHAVQRINSKLTLTEPKTERSRRTIRLPQIAAKALQTQRARQNEERLAAGGRWNDLGFVFGTSIGTPLDARNLTRHFARVLTRAGLPRLKFHSLRHSCASLLLTQHVPARAVMELLGHSEIRLTMDTYSHVMPQLMTEAANAMDDALGGGVS